MKFRLLGLELLALTLLIFLSRSGKMYGECSKVN